MGLGQIIVAMLNAAPMGGYRTYIINAALIVLSCVAAFFTGHYTEASVVIGLALSNIFQRKATDNQDSRWIMLENVIRDVAADTNKGK